jgi:hypothetical protein
MHLFLSFLFAFFAFICHVFCKKTENDNDYLTAVPYVFCWWFRFGFAVLSIIALGVVLFGT